MNATDRSKLLDAMAGVKVLVTPATLNAWDAYRELFDTDPMPSLVSEHYSARALQAWNKAPESEASCGRCGTRLRGFTPSDALLCPFCVGAVV